MNVLFLTQAYLPSLGGVQISVRNLAAELVRRGHRVVIATDGARPLTLERSDPAPVLHLRIPYPFHRRPLRRTMAHVLDAANLGALAAVCVARRIAVVHCHLVNVDTRYAVALRRLLGLKVVITLRGGELHHWVENHPVRLRYVRRMLESADAVTALSQAQLDQARRLNVSLPAETVVIPNPADPHAIGRLAARGVRPPDAPMEYLLFAGRLEAEKRVELLIDAYHRLVTEDPAYPLGLIVAGAGSQAELLRAAAQAGAGGARIRFVGARPHEDSLALIRDAAILVVPSGASEGCPNVVLEAMALGTPVVLADEGPLGELVTHDVNGSLFPAGNAAALAARLRALAADRRAGDRYAARAREYLGGRHRLDDVADRYEALYRRLTAAAR